jgi:hypothetical protein
MIIQFRLSDAQQKRFDAWVKELPAAPTGAAGGRLTYMITPTGLGTIYEVKDVVTLRSIDLTEYDEW